MGGDGRGGLSQALASRDTTEGAANTGSAVGASNWDARAAPGEAASAQGEAVNGGSPHPGTAGGGTQQQQQQQQQRHHTPANHLLNFQRYDSRGGMVRSRIAMSLGSGDNSRLPLAWCWQPAAESVLLGVLDFATAQVTMLDVFCFPRLLPALAAKTVLFISPAAAQQGFRGGGGGGAQRGRRRGASGGRPQAYDRKKFLQVRGCGPGIAASTGHAAGPCVPRYNNTLTPLANVPDKRAARCGNPHRGGGAPQRGWVHRAIGVIWI